MPGLFAEILGVSLLPGTQFRRMCEERDCVSPMHHIVCAPWKLAWRLGASKGDVIQCMATLEELAMVDPTFSVSWEPGSWQINRQAISRVMAETNTQMPRAVVLCAFSALARASHRSGNDEGDPRSHRR